MTVIKQEDFIASVAGALQYISYYHPVDYITSLAKAYEREQSPAAKDAMAPVSYTHLDEAPPNFSGCFSNAVTPDKRLPVLFGLKGGKRDPVLCVKTCFSEGIAISSLCTRHGAHNLDGRLRGRCLSLIHI